MKRLTLYKLIELLSKLNHIYQIDTKHVIDGINNILDKMES